MQAALMSLKIILPFQIFLEKNDVSRIVAESNEGSFGLLLHRRDCVSSLVPSILIYQNKEEGEIFVAIDQGILVKNNQSVIVSVRNAWIGTDLVKLQERVDKEFRVSNQQDQTIRMVMKKMESALIQNFAEFSHDR